MNTLTFQISDGNHVIAVATVEAIDGRQEDQFCWNLIDRRRSFETRYGMTLDEANTLNGREFVDELTTPEAEAGMAGAIYSQN